MAKQKGKKMILRKNMIFRSFVNNRKIKNFIFVLFFTIFIGGYGFFFSSSYILRSQEGGKTYSTVGGTYKFADREFKLVEWSYSEEQHSMEIILDILNLAYDGVDTYQIGAINRDGEKLQVKKIIEEPTLLVVHILDVPKNFSDLSLRIATDTNKSDGQLRLYTNRNEVERTDNIEELSIDEYRLVEVKNSVKDYESENVQYQNQIQDYEQKKNNAADLIKNLQKSAEIQVADDLKKTQELIGQTKNDIQKFDEEIIRLKKAIEENKQKIELAQQKLQE